MTLMEKAKMHSHPVVLVDVNTAVDEHLHDIRVAFSAGQRQRAFPPFGQQVGVGALYREARRRKMTHYDLRKQSDRVAASLTSFHTFCSRNSTTAICPCAAAHIRGVKPSSSFRLITVSV